MKLKVKIIGFLLILFTVLLINPNIVFAAGSGDAECLKDNSCLTLCNYETTFNGLHDTKIKRNITIYYVYENKEMLIQWERRDLNYNTKGLYVLSKGPAALDYIFSNSGKNIYWAADSKLSLSNFTCPTNGYLDTSEVNADNELCFDDDGVTCKEKYSNYGTAFAQHGDFESQTKTYDYEEDIMNYANNLFQTIEEEISSGQFNVVTDLKEKILTDFRVNYLHGENLPEFILNSEAYAKLTDFSAFEDSYNKSKQESMDKAQEDLDNGSITEEEYEETVNNWNNDMEDIKEQVILTFDTLKEQVDWLSDFNVSNYCTSYLGNPDFNPSAKVQAPAYYLQFAFSIMKYIAIVMLFIFTIVDFAKATVSNNQDALKKSLQSTVKRLIIVVVIFFLPLLIRLLMTLLGAYSPGTCGIY